MKKIILFLTIFLIFCRPAGTANLYDDYLKGVAGARGIGLGGAFGALADTAEAACWNPAGLGQIKSVALSGHWSNYWSETNLYGINCVWPMPVGVFGINYLQEKTGSIPLTSIDSNGRPEILGYFSDTRSVINFSYGSAVFKPNLYLGANLKFLTHSIYETSAKGYAVDFGLLYKGEDDPQSRWPINFGLTVYNLVARPLIWPSSSADNFNRQIALGAVYPFHNNGYLINFACEIKYFSSQFKLNAGIEAWLIKDLAARIGLNENGLTYGIGLKIQNRFLIDVAYYRHAELGSNYQVTTGIYW